MKEHKKNLKTMSRKELIKQVLRSIEHNTQASQNHDLEIAGLERQRDDLEIELQNAERALDKYKKLLEVSVEDL